MFGILNINKPAGCTSFDVVAKLRRILKIKQIGHTGTLDPIATGVLPICLGKATKLIQYFEDSSKAYRAYAKLGLRTDTYDREGVILEENEVVLDIEKIKETLKTFQGEITQTPPMHSAVHYKGKRLYEYARNNIEIEDIPKRQVTVNSIDFVEIQEANSKNPILVFDVDCSSGTYIRSIINDMGNLLGYGAMMDGLIRTRAGAFSITDSCTIDNIEVIFQNNSLNDILTNPRSFLKFQDVIITDEELQRVKNGNYFFVQQEKFVENEIVKIVYNEELVGIGSYRDNKIQPKNIFI